MPSKIPDAYFGKWKDRVKLLIVLVVDGVRLSDTKGRLPFINSMVDENMLAKIPFQTSGTTNVPLPKVDLVEEPALPSMIDLPEMPDLDDLLQHEKDEPPALDLPDLPDF